LVVPPKNWDGLEGQNWEAIDADDDDILVTGEERLISTTVSATWHEKQHATIWVNQIILLPFFSIFKYRGLYEYCLIVWIMKKYWCRVVRCG
jgi:hypothetical protein